jgi:hypothetical protein
MRQGKGLTLGCSVIYTCRYRIGSLSRPRTHTHEQQPMTPGWAVPQDACTRAGQHVTTRIHHAGGRAKHKTPIIQHASSGNKVKRPRYRISPADYISSGPPKTQSKKSRLYTCDADQLGGVGFPSLSLPWYRTENPPRGCALPSCRLSRYAILFLTFPLLSPVSFWPWS